MISLDVAAANGNAYASDDGGDVVRMINAAGQQTVIAGDGIGGFAGDGGPATSAQLSQPSGIAVDTSGNVAVADVGNDRIRMIAARTGTFFGVSMTAGDIYTIVGSGGNGYSGNGVAGPSAPLSLESGVNVNSGVAFDAHGNLLLADGYYSRVLVLAASSGTFYGVSMTAGDVYSIAGDGMDGTSGDGGPATAAEIADPGGVTSDSFGNVIVSDYSDRERIVAGSTGTYYGISMTAGDIYSLAGQGGCGFTGDGGPAPSAHLCSPVGAAVDGSGNLVIADLYNNRLRVVAARTGTFYGQAMSLGDIYTVAGNGTGGYAGDGGPATSAELYQPADVAVDASGNVLVADTGTERIRVVAAATGTFYGVSMTAGDMYTIAGNGNVGTSGDGGPATAAQALEPTAVTTDRSGNQVIATDDRIRVIAATSGTFYGMTMVAGDVYTIAGNGKGGYSGDGGPATSAEIGYTSGLAIDAWGNVLLADANNGNVRVVAATGGTFYGQTMSAGDIYTMAGGGSAVGDGGPATSAALSQPYGVAVDASGNVLITEFGHNRVRAVATNNGTFYGTAMTAGDIYTIAGTGVAGYSGNAGPATAAQLHYPTGITVDGSGNVVISDDANARASASWPNPPEPFTARR